MAAICCGNRGAAVPRPFRVQWKFSDRHSARQKDPAPLPVPASTCLLARLVGKLCVYVSHALRAVDTFVEYCVFVIDMCVGISGGD